MHRHTAAILVLLAALGAASCAPLRPDTAPPTVPVAERSPRAEAAYNYLKFEEARRAGNDADAQAALDALLRLDPRESVFRQGADFLWSAGRVDEARVLLKDGISRYPSSRELAVALANTYYAERRHDDAIATMSDYLARNPQDWTAYKDMALIHLDAGQHAQALENLRSIPPAERNAAILYYSAKASAGLGLNRQAREMLREAVTKDVFFVEAWAELAYLFEVDGNYLEAEKVYTRLLDLGETGSEVHLRLISLNLKLNQPDRALEIYRKGPTDPAYALEAAALFMDEKFYEQARAVLVPLSERGDAPDRIWFSMAVLAYEGDSDAGRAIRYLERIPDTDPNYHRAAQFRIHLLLDKGETEQALDLIHELADRYPDQSQYPLLEAGYHQRQGDNAQALAVLDKAVSRWPEDTQLLYSRGVVLEKLGRTDEGLEVMEQIITIDSEHADALNFLGYMLADQGRELERALMLVSRALEIEPDNGYIIDSLAWVHFRLGDTRKAWELAQRAVEHVADEADIWEHYGDIAARMGLRDKAREGYRNSLELRPGEARVQGKLDAL